MMSSMPKYALRYLPLLVLALLLIPLRVFMVRNSQQQKIAVPSSQNASPFRQGAALYGVTMLSANEGWAVGGSFSTKPGAEATTGEFIIPSGGIILHYMNNVWVVGKVANSPLRFPLLSVSMDSSSDGWAVGWSGTLVHYHGGAWSTEQGPTNFNQNLLGVVMLSSANGWAAGYSGSILHYDGKQWTQAESPTRVDLRSIAMSSAQEGWAVGDNGTILHYSNDSWQMIGNSPTSNTLNSVTMLSVHEGWAAGKQGTILHYRDGVWERVYPASYYQPSQPSRQPVNLYSVAMNSIRSGWIIGDQHFLTYSSEAWVEPQLRIDFLKNRTGTHLTLNDFSLYSIALLPDGEGWAVGSNNIYPEKDVYSSTAPAILHYQGGIWTIPSISS